MMRACNAGETNPSLQWNRPRSLDKGLFFDKTLLNWYSRHQGRNCGPERNHVLTFKPLKSS